MKIVPVKIPVGLGSRVVWQRDCYGEMQLRQSNRIIRNVDTFLCLKAQTDSGKIQGFKRQAKALAAFCKIGSETLYTRLERLKEMGLVAFEAKQANRASTITLASWKTLFDMFDLPVNKINDFNEISYDLDDKKSTIEYYLKAQDSYENQQSQLRAIEVFAEKNSSWFLEVCEIAEEELGADSARLQNKDWEYFQSILQELQIMSFISYNDESKYRYRKLNIIRADINRSLTGITNSHKYRNISVAAYMRRQLVERKLATADNITIESRGRMRLDADLFQGFKYNSTKKSTFLTLPTQLNLLSFGPKRENGESRGGLSLAA